MPTFGEDEENITKYRRHKHSRACDLCRKRKVSCDASERPDNCCTRCSSQGLQCQYIPLIKEAKRPATTRSYVDLLEDRLGRMEDLLDKLHETRTSSDVAHTSEIKAAVGTATLPSSVTPAVRPPVLDVGENEDSEGVEPSDDEGGLSLDTSISYEGNSSARLLVRALLEMKNRRASKHLTRKPLFSETSFALRCYHIPSSSLGETRPFTNFPEPDLLKIYIDAYFKNQEIYQPLLHRPTFEQDIKEGLHLLDRRFGAIVLLVCANGSVWARDPRIERDGFSVHQAGVEFVEPLMSERFSLLDRPSLDEIQAICLLSSWLINTKSREGPWVLLSRGIRLALAVGAHRKKMYSAKTTVEELWRRAFWWMINLDRAASFLLGRPCAIQDEDFDLDPLPECDDEYWVIDGPHVTLHQPPGVPSKIAFSNAYARLMKILAFASRTLYSINKSKLLFGFVGAEWKQEIIAELDSALNRWIDSVPSHLRWDPNCAHLDFFTQSACLYTTYYQVQICVHRPFLPSLRSPPPPNLVLPSLAICTRAARACISIYEAYLKRVRHINWTFGATQMPLFHVCIVLLYHLWGGNPSERETQTLVEDINRCFSLLDGMAANGSHAASKVHAILAALLNWKPKGPVSSAKRTAGCPSSGPTKSDVSSASAGQSNVGDLLSDMFGRMSLAFGRDPESSSAAGTPRVCGQEGQTVQDSSSASLSRAVDAIVADPLAMGQEQPQASSPFLASLHNGSLCGLFSYDGDGARAVDAQEHTTVHSSADASMDLGDFAVADFGDDVFAWIEGIMSTYEPFPASTGFGAHGPTGNSPPPDPVEWGAFVQFDE